MENPGECDLARLDALRFRDVADHCCSTHVRIEVLALISWVVATEIVRWKLLGPLHSAREKPAPERRERHEPDAELAQQRNDRHFEVPLPQRVLALQGRDWMRRVRAPDVLLAGLRESEKAHFAGMNQLGHRPDDFLDRNRWVDAMLIQQVDMVGAQPTKRSF